MNFRQVRIGLLAALLVCALSPQAGRAQRIIADISVDLQRLPEEAQKKLETLDSTLTVYLGLSSQLWNKNDHKYEVPIQISIFLTDYNANPQEDKYKANLIVTNKQEARFDDKRWEFGLRQPVQFAPGQFSPFTSVIEFYVWILIGNEEDKYEKLGGGEFYNKAKDAYLASTNSLYFLGWDKRIDLLRSITSDLNNAARELNFFYYTGIYYDGQKEFATSKNYLHFALARLENVTGEVRDRFLEVNHQQLAEALVRAGYADGVKRLVRLDPVHKDVYDEAVAGERSN